MGRLVFVYGTLKSGFRLNDAMTKLGGVLKCEAFAMQYVLIDTHGSFPYMITASDWIHQAYGELWEFPANTDFTSLNNIEVPAGYVPYMIDVTANNKDKTYYCDVMTYVMPGLHYDGNVVRSITTNNTVVVKEVYANKPWGRKQPDSSTAGLKELFKKNSITEEEEVECEVIEGSEEEL
jgi:gamma-glutamylcyclotransferase (GGCT)/AIG2-like uncharacterized protein YtfP